jgi:hypothetical protein
LPASSSPRSVAPLPLWQRSYFKERAMNLIDLGIVSSQTQGAIQGAFLDSVASFKPTP